MKIYVRKTKKIKGIPTLVKKEVEFKESVKKTINDLCKKNTTYFEVIAKGSKIKTVFTKETWQKNYIKKEVKV